MSWEDAGSCRTASQSNSPKVEVPRANHDPAADAMITRHAMVVWPGAVVARHTMVARQTLWTRWRRCARHGGAVDADGGAVDAMLALWMRVRGAVDADGRAVDAMAVLCTP
ncbi:hypothetical protein GCM10023170_024610 [Phytohabitans houttuyneae]|uniref:Uncharacterized protein n=1 Tax=Phytohabitans houttuyneae TaxID=1076126 RepID=A0A6V8KKG0_9ACTN|nr:hypothetical protein Phou_071580 [Phytohabitans houttuyneae]